MSFRSLLRQDVTIVHAGTATDRYQNVVPDWNTATRTTVKGLAQQTDSVEVTVGRDTVTANVLLFLLPDAPITAYDRVELEGAAQLEVVGLPAVLSNRSGPHHIEARLRTVTG